MTTKRIAAQTSRRSDIIKFPDRPDSFDMTTYRHLTSHGLQASLSAHFGDPETTIVNSEVAAGVRPTESYEGVLFPDLLIAFNADLEAEKANNGYAISQQGKPPDFVLEIASDSTAKRDETYKRRAYANMGIPEYWRFDAFVENEEYYEAPLSGDRLENGVYAPIPIHRTDNGLLWGHSDALNLDLCWENGNLRFWDPVTRLYLPTFLDERAARRATEARADAESAARRAAENRADAESAARRAAEDRADAESAARRAAEDRAAAEAARVRQLEAELRRLQNL